MKSLVGIPGTYRVLKTLWDEHPELFERLPGTLEEFAENGMRPLPEEMEAEDYQA